MSEPRPTRWAGAGVTMVVMSGALIAASACKERRTANLESPPVADTSVAVAEKLVELPGEVLAAFSALPARFERGGSQLTDEEIELGKALYSDARWSASGKVSCNSCHDLARFGVDGREVAQGGAGKWVPQNTPTVLNAAGAAYLGSLGQHSDLEKFLELHIQQTLAPTPASFKSVAAQMDSTAPSAAPAALRKASLALGAFLRTLVTPTRFDKFLSGERQAFSSQEKAGLLVFFQYCAECHRGALLGGDRIAKLGVKHTYVDPNPDAGVGLASVTGKDADKWLFRVPPLRNVSETGPYLHHGAVSTLRGTVEMMGWLQSSAMFSDKDAAAVLAFLRTLTAAGPAPAAPAQP